MHLLKNVESIGKIQKKNKVKTKTYIHTLKMSKNEPEYRYTVYGRINNGGELGPTSYGYWETLGTFSDGKDATKREQQWLRNNSREDYKETRIEVEQRMLIPKHWKWKKIE